MSTSTEHLATVRNITGKIIRLGMFEEVYGIAITQTRVTVGINRAKVRSANGGDTVYMRGKTVLTIDLTNSGWKVTQSVPVWWSTDETHVARQPVQPDTEWEDMCYRPGTVTSPMDNAARISQGY